MDDVSIKNAGVKYLRSTGVEISTSPKLEHIGHVIFRNPRWFCVHLFSEIDTLLGIHGLLSAMLVSMIV